MSLDVRVSHGANQIMFTQRAKVREVLFVVGQRLPIFCYQSESLNCVGYLSCLITRPLFHHLSLSRYNIFSTAFKPSNSQLIHYLSGIV